MKKIIALVMTIAMVAALAVTTSAADMADDYLFYFSFDNAEDGLSSNGVTAHPVNLDGDYTANLDSDNAHRGSALALANKEYWLTVANEDGTSPLTGLHDFTISWWSNSDCVGPNWAFFACPNIDGVPYQQVYLSEKYIGALENTGLTCERFLCNGARTITITGIQYEEEWQMFTLTYTDDTITLFQDGEIWIWNDTCPEPVTDILTDDSTFFIGTATWDGIGTECYTGAIDDFVVYPYAMTEEQVAALYAAQGGAVEEEPVDTAPADTKAPETKAPETEAPETKAPETQAPAADTKAPEEEKSGCGSAMGAAAVIVALTATLGCAIVKKH